MTNERKTLTLAVWVDNNSGIRHLKPVINERTIQPLLST